MCADPAGSDLESVSECLECGSLIDVDGDSTEVCPYSPDDPCDVCGSNPCSGYC